MRDKFNRFMQGRYGADPFARFTSILACVLIVLSLFCSRNGNLGSALDLLGLILLVYTYFRILSRDHQKRYQENQKYLSATEKIRSRIQQEKNLLGQRKTHHIYSCTGCGQKIRIPRGKGKIEIDCPKCHTKFIKRS